MVNKSYSLIVNEDSIFQRISVVIPVYNEESSLSICLESIRKQIYPQDKLEIIVVDDGSTDQSAKIAIEYGARVMYQKHLGPAAARNMGAGVASGTLIAFIDADDKAHENWLTKIVPYFLEASTAAVGCNHELLNKKNDFVKITWLERYFRINRSPDKVDHLNTSGSVYRSRTIEEVGGFDCNLRAAEDMDLAFRVNNKGWILYMVKEPLIDVQYPDSWFQYFRNQIRNSAYIIPFRWKSRKTSRKVTNTYSGVSDYLQSLFLYAFIFCLFFLLIDRMKYLPAITTSILLVSLLSLSISFIIFVFKYRSKLRLSLFSPIVLLFYLVIRALSWSCGLLYGCILIFRSYYSSAKPLEHGSTP